MTIRSGYESILRFYGYDLGDTDDGNVAMITTTPFNRREQDEPETSTPMHTTVPVMDIPTTTILPITSSEIPHTTIVDIEPPTTQTIENKVTEAKLEAFTSTTTAKLTDMPTEIQVDSTTEKFTEAFDRVPETSSKEPSVPSTLPPTTIPTERPYETTILSTQTTSVPTTRFTTEETTMIPITEMTTKPTHIFTFKPITTTPQPDDITTKRFYNMQTTIPPLSAIRSLVSDAATNQKYSLKTTVPVPTDVASARFVNARNARTSRVKKDASIYNSFVSLTSSSGYGVSSDVNFYDPYFSYATPNPADPYSEVNPIFATRDFLHPDHDHHHDDEIDHIFYLNPHDSIRIGFKLYNTILRFAYVTSIQASALELPLDSENYSLLILIPDQPIEHMVNVLCSHLSPSLATIRASLKDNWIKTMIPKFQLKGNVVLTGDLMKVSRNNYWFVIRQVDYYLHLIPFQIGIQDIFEPNKADFSPMTDEFGIYARHIEQSITINIRTHANNQLRRKYDSFLFCLNSCFDTIQCSR